MFDRDDESDGGVITAPAPTGADLALRLQELNLDGVDEGDLVDVAAECMRLAAWAEARAAEATSLLVDRLISVRSPAQELSAPSRKVAAAELSLRLGITRQAALRRVRTARLLNGPLLATGEALEQGWIDHRKADIIAGSLEGIPIEVAIAVEESVLPKAHRRTPPQLQQDLQKALIEADPEWAANENARARSKRRVNHCRPMPSGMVSIYAVLPAAEGTALDLGLEAAARTAKASGDTRTVDQLRADILGTIAVDALRTGHFGGAAPCGCASTGGKGGRLGGSAVGPGTGSSGEAASGTGGTVTSPGADSPAATAGTAASSGASFPLGSLGGQPVRVDVTVPLNTLLGGDEPGELEGYGAIDPVTARALALGGTWRRLVTDPLTGTVLDVGRSRYRPPQELATLVRERDRTCVGGGCRTKARACDLDHTVAFAAGGTTALHNLGCMCPSWCHLLKSTGDFTVKQLRDGVFEWTSKQTGHSYRREADGTTTYLGRPEGKRAPASDMTDWLRRSVREPVTVDDCDPVPF